MRCIEYGNTETDGYASMKSVCKRHGKKIWWLEGVCERMKSVYKGNKNKIKWLENERINSVQKCDKGHGKFGDCKMDV